MSGPPAGLDSGPRVLLEICIDSLAGACAARDGGADRLEVCTELWVGGLTPSAGLLAAVRAEVDLPLHMLIRPRAGDFRYTDNELDVMERDILAARTAGAQGVVLGVLTTDHDVDRERTGRLVDAARPLAVTFHRAFDFTPDPLRSLEVVAALGIERVLTSGGRPSVPEGLDMLTQLVEAAGNRVIVMPGGGVRSGAVARILAMTRARELHASASSRAARGADPDEVRRMVAALSSPRV